MFDSFSLRDAEMRLHKITFMADNGTCPNLLFLKLENRSVFGSCQEKEEAKSTGNC